MPTYEYKCQKCEDVFEKFQSFHARPLRTHSGCGGKLQKVFHPRGVVFKGSGFYVTDSRPARSTTSSNGSNGEAKSDESKKSAETSETTETATTAKSDSKETSGKEKSKSSTTKKTKAKATT